jgi:hypothetical protein
MKIGGVIIFKPKKKEAEMLLYAQEMRNVDDDNH